MQRRFESGRAALREGRVDDAVADLLQCVIEDPASGLYVAAFLESLKHPRRRVSWRTRLAMLEREWRFQKAVGASDHETILQVGPELLAHRSDDGRLIRALAEACAAFRLADSETAYLRWGLALRPDDVELLKSGARSFARKALFDDAYAAWNRVTQLAPEDELARRALEAWTDASHEKPEVRHATAPRHDGSEGHVMRVDDDELAMRNSLCASPGDWQTLERLEDLQCARIAESARLAARLAEIDPHPEFDELLAALERERTQRELEVLDARSARHPADDDLKMRVVRLLKQAGKFREAILRLETIQRPSACYAAAQLELGECRQRLRQFDGALAAYRCAIDAVNEWRARNGANSVPDDAAAIEAEARRRAEKLSGAMEAAARGPIDASEEYDGPNGPKRPRRP